METEDELRLVEYWLENPNSIIKIPEDLKEKITDEDAVKAFVKINTSITNNGLRILEESNIFEHTQKLRQKLKDELEIKNLKNKTKIIFDSQIFDFIDDGKLNIDKILNSKTKGFEYYISHIQVEESTSKRYSRRLLRAS